MKMIPTVSVTAALLIAAVPAQAEPPRVVASIAPIHSLVSSVMEGVATPELLIPANVSGHDYALKPSDLRKIAGADLVIWVGDALETYLIKPLETEDVAHLALLDLEEVDPHPYSQVWEANEHATADEDAHEDGHEHDHEGLDPHVWLDPVRAVAIVHAVAVRLAEVDPANADVYAANAERNAAALRALDEDIEERLAALSDKPFVTFHDGYSYFAARYGLKQVGQLTLHPEQRPGAASLSELQATIAREGVSCIFAEPQFDPGVIRSLAGDADVRIGTIDALGVGLDPGGALYPALLRRNAEEFAACLAPAR